MPSDCSLVTTMASSSKILVTPSVRPVYGVPKLDPTNADRVTALLQESEYTELLGPRIPRVLLTVALHQTMISIISSSAQVASM